MKKIFVILFIFTLAGFTFGQSKTDLGIQGNLAIPMGDFGEYYDLGYGGLLSFYFNISPGFALGVNSGYQIWDATGLTNTSLSAIPVLGAFRYYFGVDKFKPYVLGSVGGYYTVTKYEYELLGVKYSGSDSEFHPGFSAGIGFVYKVSPMVGIDFTGRFSNIFRTNDSNTFIDICAGALFCL
ncbi:MAG: hypothetical protein JXA68_02865 [Ignavibacteriales bacterium]|nr:hypothetical protein [Ignavibacteriales bacterium]